MAGARIQLKRATASSWSSNNPVLFAGEIGLETDTNKFKIGDGTTAFNSLPYFNGNLTGSSLNDLADVTIVSAANGDFLRWNGTAWINDAVNLSTDTVGSYVESLVAGTGVTLTNNSGEAATPTIAIGQSVATSASVTFAHVSAPLSGNVIGNVTGDVSGNAGTATALQNARAISLGGDLSGSASFNGTSDITITAAVQPNSIALGTDTTGNYMSDLTQGTGVTITHTPGEGSNATIAIGQSVATSASVTFAMVTVTETPIANTHVATKEYVDTGISNAALVSIDEIGDVIITSPEEFQGLSYNGTNWVNSHIPLVSYVQNAEATTLTTGTVVYLFGGTGDHASVKRADNNADSTSSKTIGLVGANIAASQNGPVITRGYVDGIDLSVGYATGDVLWLGENGAFTKTKPSAPDHLVFVGVVVRATNNGIIYVATQNGYELEELHDVKITNLASNDFLKYNSASAVWVNDQINLGTDTVGDYVQNLVAGTGVTLSNNSGEGSTPTISIGQDVSTSASVTFAHLDVQGDMHVQGTIIRLNETNLDIDEAFVYLNANSASANPDMGIAFNYNDGSYKHAGFFRDSSDGLFKIFDSYTPEPQTPIDTSHGSYNDASLQVRTISLTQPTGTAPLSVSSSTVVTNLNADKLDGQDGSYYAPIDSPTFTGTVTLPNNTVALGSQTTGNYMVDISGGTGISIAHTQAEGSTATVALNATLDDLLNVSAPTPSDGQFLKYVTASSGWVPAAIPTINNLDDVGDVVITSAASGQFLKWNGTAWVNDAIDLGTDTTGNYVANVSGGTGITVTHTPGEGSSASVALNATLDDLSNVTVPSPTDGYVLTYSSASSAWIAQAGAAAVNSLDDIGGVNINFQSLGNGDYLTYDGQNWVNSQLSLSLDGLSDVAVSGQSLASGDILKYNGQNWENAVFNLDDIGDVNVSPQGVGEVLIYGDGAWTNEAPTSFASRFNLDDIGNVEINFQTQASGDILQYNGQTWVNVAFPSTDRDVLVRFYMEVI